MIRTNERAHKETRIILRRDATLQDPVKAGTSKT
jgi:hypothetical protein